MSNAIEIAIRILSDESGLTALVDNRIYAVAAPERITLPYVVVATVAESDDAMLSGPAKWYESRVSVTAVARTATAVSNIGEAIKDAFEGLVDHATIESDDESPSEAIASDVVAWKDGADFTDHSEDRSVFRRVIDWRIRWKKP